jgi:predicted nucleotide-binding protein (sugar kinase/HSP70/actin superfamily)
MMDNDDKEFYMQKGYAAAEASLQEQMREQLEEFLQALRKPNRLHAVLLFNRMLIDVRSNEIMLVKDLL